METPIGLTPEEMIRHYNEMYLEVWNRTRQRIDWEIPRITEQLRRGQEIDLGGWLVGVLEVVITAARDGTVLAIAENNERLYRDLQRAGVITTSGTPGEDAG